MANPEVRHNIKQKVFSASSTAARFAETTALVGSATAIQSAATINALQARNLESVIMGTGGLATATIINICIMYIAGERWNRLRGNKPNSSNPSQ